MQTVLVVGGDQLRTIIHGIMAKPDGPLSFGFVCVRNATISDLKAEVLHAVVPRTPDAVCMLAPGYNHRQSIPTNLQDFDELLSTVCYCWPRVCLLSFMVFSERFSCHDFPCV